MAGNKHWQKSEMKILKDHYSGISARKLAEALPGRSERSISSMANRLSLGKSPERRSEQGRENQAFRKIMLAKHPEPSEGSPPNRAA